MKSGIIIIISIFFISIPAFAQPGIGFTAGMNNTTFEAQENFNNSAETQFQFGAYIDFPVLPFLGVTAGLNYAKRSSSMEFISPVVPFNDYTLAKEYAYSMNYIEIPVLLKFGAPIIPGKLAVSFLVGPQLNFLASGDVEMTDYLDSASSSNIDDFDSPVFGVTTGVRFELAAGAGAFTFDVFYNYDLTTTKEATFTNNSIAIKMRKYSLSAGYYLPLKVW